MIKLTILYRRGRKRPIVVAARSKAWLSGSSLAWIAGSNPAGNMAVFPVVSVVCCQVEVFATGRSLFQGSPTGCVCVIECDQVQH